MRPHGKSECKENKTNISINIVPGERRKLGTLTDYVERFIGQFIELILENIKFWNTSSLEKVVSVSPIPDSMNTSRLTLYLISPLVSFLMRGPGWSVSDVHVQALHKHQFVVSLNSKRKSKPQTLTGQPTQCIVVFTSAPSSFQSSCWTRPVFIGLIWERSNIT